MIIDCAGCAMRDLACGDCVVTFLLGPAEGIGSEEQAALAVLADGGLVPPLRMRPVARPADARPPVRRPSGARGQVATA